MVSIYNPALHEEPRDRRPEAIPLRRDESIIRWLEDQGRLMSRGWEDVELHQYYSEVYGEGDEELHREFEDIAADELEDDDVTLEE